MRLRLLINIRDREHSEPIKDRFIRSGTRQTLWHFFTLFAAYTIFRGYISEEGLVNGFWTAMPFSAFAIGLLIFLIYLATYRVLFCDNSFVGGVLLGQNLVCLAKEWKYEDIERIQYEQRDIRMGRISLWLKGEVDPKCIDFEYFAEEDKIWTYLCGKLDKGVFDSSAEERLGEVTEIRLKGPEPLTWKKIFSFRIRKYGKK